MARLGMMGIRDWSLGLIMYDGGIIVSDVAVVVVVMRVIVWPWYEYGGRGIEMCVYTRDLLIRI